jgi:hypothetical protein
VILNDLLAGGQANAAAFVLPAMKLLKYFKNPVFKHGVKTQSIITERNVKIFFIEKKRRLF